MEYLALIYADEPAWERFLEGEREAAYEEYTEFARAAGDAGVVAGERELGPTASATTVRVRDGRQLVTDGPYAEAKEALGGYFILDRRPSTTRSRGRPGSRARSHGAVEVRQVHVDEEAWREVRAARLQRPVRLGRDGRGGGGRRRRAESMPRWLTLFEEMGKADRTPRGRSSSRRTRRRSSASSTGRPWSPTARSPRRRSRSAAVLNDAPRPRRGDPDRLARAGRRVRLAGGSAYRGAVTLSLEATFREDGLVPSGSSPASSATSARRGRGAGRVRDRTRALATGRDPPPLGAWIVATARNGAIDRIRRERTFARKAELLARLEAVPADEDADVSSIPDERLALLFTCCHPALAVDARIALTLREVRGLQTPEIARAFLVTESALAQRLVRAKRRLREAGSLPRAARPPAPRPPLATCSASSTSSSTRAMRRRPATCSCAASSARRRSGSASSSAS